MTNQITGTRPPRSGVGDFLRLFGHRIRVHLNQFGPPHITILSEKIVSRRCA
jgi:hypothetical protein